MIGDGTKTSLSNPHCNSQRLSSALIFENIVADISVRMSDPSSEERASKRPRLETEVDSKEHQTTDVPASQPAKAKSSLGLFDRLGENLGKAPVAERDVGIEEYVDPTVPPFKAI